MDKLAKNLLQTLKESYNLTDREHRKILRMYNKSRKNINQFIAELYIHHGNDGVIDYNEYLSRHVQDVESFLINESRKLAEYELAIFAIVLTQSLSGTYNKTAYHLEQNLKVGINFNLLRPEFIEKIVSFNWSGIPFSERIWNNQSSLINSLRQELVQGIKAGESLDKIARRINKQFNKKGYISQRLIRTEVARVIAEAQEQIYRDSGAVEKVQFLATLDNRTSEICQELDGKQYDLDDKDKPEIPQHPNCRSCYIPIIDGYEPAKRKDNTTKEIIEYQNYEEWAKSKGIT